MISIEDIVQALKLNEVQLWFAVETGHTQRLKELKTQRDLLKQDLIDLLNAELLKARKAAA